MLYAGKSRSGPIWKTLELRQKTYLKNMGVEAPFELITNALGRLFVVIESKRSSLKKAMLNGSHFRDDEQDELWDLASAFWAKNNSKVFIWRGITQSGLKHSPILDSIELPIQLLQNGKLTAFNQQQIRTALERIRKGEELDAELRKADREFRDLYLALQKRGKLLAKHHWVDALSERWH